MTAVPGEQTQQLNQAQQQEAVMRSTFEMGKSKDENAQKTVDAHRAKIAEGGHRSWIESLSSKNKNSDVEDNRKLENSFSYKRDKDGNLVRDEDAEAKFKTTKERTEKARKYLKDGYDNVELQKQNEMVEDVLRGLKVDPQTAEEIDGLTEEQQKALAEKKLRDPEYFKIVQERLDFNLDKELSTKEVFEKQQILDSAKETAGSIA